MTKTKVLMVLFLPLLLVSMLAHTKDPDPVAAELDNNVLLPSVRVQAKSGTGSGTIFKMNGNEYVITAGHVIEGDKEVKEVEVVNDKGITEKKQKTYWPGFYVTRTLFKDNQEIGELRLKAEMIAFSPPEEHGGLDIAVLKMVEQPYMKSTARWLDSDGLKPGDDIAHVGNIYGDVTGGFCKGSIIRIDLAAPELNNSKFLVGHLGGMRRGSSGGGVFYLKEGKYYWIGMVVRGDAGGLSLIKTSHVIEGFLKEQKLDKLITDSK